MSNYVEKILALLADNDPVKMLEASPAKLEACLYTLSEENLQRSYAAGKWTASEIFAHLADVELIFGLRVRQVVADVPEIQIVDESIWAKKYARLDASLAVEAFRALRVWNLAFLTTLDLQDWLKEVYHPERGTESLDLMIRLWAGHDLNHLSQLEQIAQLKEGVLSEIT